MLNDIVCYFHTLGMTINFSYFLWGLGQDFDSGSKNTNISLLRHSSVDSDA